MLTSTCLLRNYSIAITVPDKTAKTVVEAFLQHIYAAFGSLLALITDNMKEFKNELLPKVAEKIGIECQFLSSHHPNEKIS